MFNKSCLQILMKILVQGGHSFRIEYFSFSCHNVLENKNCECCPVQFLSFWKGSFKLMSILLPINESTVEVGRHSLKVALPACLQRRLSWWQKGLPALPDQQTSRIKEPDPWANVLIMMMMMKRRDTLACCLRM
jgi:hypothetical protein